MGSLNGLSGLSGLSSLIGLSQTYIEKILSIDPSSLIAYYLLNELAGPTADNAEGTAARDGTYVGATPDSAPGPGGLDTTPFFDGTDDYVQMPSAAIDAPFDPLVGTLSCWVRVNGASVWTDGSTRRAVAVGVNTNNRVMLYKFSGANTLSLVYTAGGASDVIDFTTSRTDWINLIGTWDKSGADEIELFIDNVSAGTSSPLGIWAGSLADLFCRIGSVNNANYWHGYIAHVTIWNKVLDSSERGKIAII